MKKIALGLAGLLAIIALGGYFIFANLDHIIKETIEKYASAATQSTVSLSSVDLQLSSGDAKLNGLTVGNPKGFTTPQAFYLGLIEIKLDPSTLRGTGPIVAQQVLIDKPQVTYELLNDGTSNLQKIQENAQAYAGSFQGKKTSPKTDPATTAMADPSKTQPGRKFIINDLVIRNGQISISQELLQGKQLSAPLPEIHLTNIGKENGGATAAQVASQVFTSLTNSAAQASVTELAKEKLNGVLKAVPAGAIGGAAVDTIGKGIQGVFGK